MADISKTGGGIGTNQYKIKGVSVAKAGERGYIKGGRSKSNTLKPHSKQMEKIFESASKFQKLIPNAILVGGSATSFYANHRKSYDHDHILIDFEKRYDEIFDTLKNTKDFDILRYSKGKTILGKLDGVSAGIRQLIRKKPLEIEEHTLINGAKIKVPTLDEITRIKAYMALSRGYGRDYIDLIALYDKNGNAVKTLLKIDDYYESNNKTYKKPLATELILKLSDVKKDNFFFKIKKSDIIFPYNDFEYINKKAKEIAIKMQEQNEVF
jgi:hypothetical protein